MAKLTKISQFICILHIYPKNRYLRQIVVSNVEIQTNHRVAHGGIHILYYRNILSVSLLSFKIVRNPNQKMCSGDNAAARDVMAIF